MRELETGRSDRRMEAAQEELADRIGLALPREGAVEPRPFVHFRRHSRPGERVPLRAKSA